MEADVASRYRSRILREMNANRENPFNSPPSSTGSHGTVSPTMSSVFSDPDGESTRRLHEDIARVTAAKKLPINWDAAHKKWPEYYSAPKNRDAPIFRSDNIDLRALSSESKENKPPGHVVKFLDDSTQDTWAGSKRTRAEMQPRVDNDSDASSLLNRSPARGMAYYGMSRGHRNPSPLAKGHARAPSTAAPSHKKRRTSISEVIDRLRKTSLSPKDHDQGRREHGSPHMSSARSSLTAVPPDPEYMSSPAHNASHARSFFMPDVSHLGDFVTGTLRFSGNMKNGVPIFVKHGQVHDEAERPSAHRHAEVDAVEVPEDEEKIFVSMDMIREEIISLQGHYDKVQDYARDLQNQVDALESQLKQQKVSGNGFGSDRVTEAILSHRNHLEVEVASLQTRLEEASRKMSMGEIEKDALCQERDRAVKRLQEACDDISKLTRKLGSKEKELEHSQRQQDSTGQTRHENETLRRDLVSVRHSRDALELENNSLRAEQEASLRERQVMQEEVDTLRREKQALISENTSLRSQNEALANNADPRADLDAQYELDAVREELETLQQKAELLQDERDTLREDNDSLVRHNEKYFDENKMLRRENSGFERSIQDLHDENLKLRDEVQFLKQSPDLCRPINQEELSGRVDDETEENMTSAFFVPDITMKSNEQAGEPSDTRDMIPPQDLVSQTTKDFVVLNKSHSGKAKSSRMTNGNHKVAFSLPDDSTQESRETPNVSKRRSSSQSTHRSSLKNSHVVEHSDYEENDDTTGLQSMDDSTKDVSMSMSVPMVSRKDFAQQKQRQSLRFQSRAAKSTSVNGTQEVSVTGGKATCPALSQDARKVLDNLCEHNCPNCIVCSRIISHAGVMTSKEIADGKKRVAVPRPVPVTDRDLSGDHTMRPLQSPGHALALVIKGLEDEAHHLQLELSQLQAQYSSSDKALGRRNRQSLAEGIRTMLKRLEMKNDQIYSLYDVLEGQKAAGQAMTEEELEITVLSITGMTVRDVTAGSDQMTWEGIQEV